MTSRTVLASNSIAFEQSTTNKGKICFRNHDEKVAIAINQQIQERKEAENMELIARQSDWWDNNGLIVIGMVLFAIVAMVAIGRRND